MNTFIPIHQARQQLGELINQAYYKGTPFFLTRGKKPMATLIGTNEFKQILKVIEKHDPGLTDTLAIMTNPEVMKILEDGEEEIRKGHLIPFDKAVLGK
ncbi:type II toxin-antitoxin system Phd/YefM family antitoxin [Candidatus Gottesmanbacteria bacterium]|nr:type II toxin-antitoxin system Phd/YefM family antitoxin [Candidatus Gottesmanbacteria bacterium]